ncbi:hypothetical protein ACLB1N_01445 [Escherichia coli]
MRIVSAGWCGSASTNVLPPGKEPESGVHTP